MSDEKVKVSVEAEGTQQAGTQIESVATALDHVSDTATQAHRATTTATEGMGRLASGGQLVAQRIQGAAGAAQALAGAIGSHNNAAGLLATVAGATAQFAAMGSVLGPGGAVIGGLVGLGVSVAGMASAHRDAQPLISATTALIREEGEAAGNATTRMREFLNSISTSGRTAGVAGLADQITELTDEMYRLRDAGDAIGAAAMRERIRTLSQMEANDRSDIAGETAGIGRPRTATGAGADPVTTAVDFNERYRDETARILTERLNETDRINDEILDIELARIAAQEDAERAYADAALEREQNLQAELSQAGADAELQRQARLIEGIEAMKAAQVDADQSALEGREEFAGEMTGLLGNVTMSFGKTIAAIATGEKSADEAFKGFTAGFLEMISQYTTLKAATEFAEAGASFARYDYAGGAAHAAVGVAFTAVAVATGVGAAALSAAPQAPARPETSGIAAENSGGNVVINWNSPVVTASTRAELGREISSMVGEAASI